MTTCCHTRSRVYLRQGYEDVDIGGDRAIAAEGAQGATDAGNRGMLAGEGRNGSQGVYKL